MSSLQREREKKSIVRWHYTPCIVVFIQHYNERHNVNKGQYLEIQCAFVFVRNCSRAISLKCLRTIYVCMCVCVRLTNITHIRMKLAVTFFLNVNYVSINENVDKDHDNLQSVNLFNQHTNHTL